MHLTIEHAMEIVARLESIQPHKVVVINEEGIIIGASDQERVGVYHPAAVCRMRKAMGEELTPCNPDDDILSGNGTCVRVNGQIIGVIGLDGAAEEISLFLRAAESIVELMLERELLSKELRIQNASQKKLLTSLLSDQPHKVEELMWALDFHNINIDVPRTVLLIELSALPNIRGERMDPLLLQTTIHDFFGAVPRFFSYQEDLILCNELESNIVILCADRSKTDEVSQQRIHQICTNLAHLATSEYHLDCQIVIGECCNCLADYFGQYHATRHMLLAGKLMFPDQGIYFGKSLLLGNLISTISDQHKASIVGSVLGMLLANRQRDCYLQTLEALFNCDMNMNESARQLYIHRNSLQYRIHKIQELTRYSLYELDGIVTLRIAYLCYKQSGSPPVL